MCDIDNLCAHIHAYRMYGLMPSVPIHGCETNYGTLRPVVTFLPDNQVLPFHPAKCVELIFQ